MKRVAARPAVQEALKAEGLLGLALITTAEVRNEDEARRWVRKAAADGDPLGQTLLGEFLVFGRAGVEKNESEGVAWIEDALSKAPRPLTTEADYEALFRAC